LVDALGGVKLAVETAAGLCGIENYSIKEYPAKKDFFTSLLGSSSEAIVEKIRMEFMGKELYQQKRMMRAWQNYDCRQAIMPEFINQ
jgi:hypothetical protein